MSQLDFKAVLNVRAAKAAMRDLHKAARAGQRRGIRGLGQEAARHSRRLGRRLVPAVGAIGALSAMQRILGSRSQGSVDPWVEAITPEIAAMEQAAAQGTNFYAAAAKRARADVREVLRTEVGVGGWKEGHRNLYTTALRIRTDEARGALILRQDKDFTGPSLPELLAKGATGYANLVEEAVDYFLDKIRG